MTSTRMQSLLALNGLTSQNYTSVLQKTLADDSLSEDEKLFTLNETISTLTNDSTNQPFRTALSILQLYTKQSNPDRSQTPELNEEFQLKQDTSQLGPFELLKNLFSNLDSSEILESLESNNYDMERVIYHLTDSIANDYQNIERRNSINSSKYYLPNYQPISKTKLNLQSY